MSLKYQILGQHYMDNAMYVKIDTGQKNYHILFDLGYACLENMDISLIMDIDHIFLSHLHVDHISGFDFFFRFNYNRAEKPIHFWVPKDSAKTLHHKFQGFTWNLIDESTPGIFYIHEVDAEEVKTYRITSSEKYSVLNLLEKKAFTGVLVENDNFFIKSIILNHGIDSLGFKIEEKPRTNISKEKLKEHGLTPGPWIGKIQNPKFSDFKMIEIHNKKYSFGELKKLLFVCKKGDSLAYLTDFHTAEKENNRISQFINPCNTLVCETQYLHEDIELADKNRHMTAKKAGTLAKLSDVEKLVLFHLSSRYKGSKPQSFVDEAKIEFSNTFLPNNWII